MMGGREVDGKISGNQLKYCNYGRNHKIESCTAAQRDRTRPLRQRTFLSLIQFKSKLTDQLQNEAMI